MPPSDSDSNHILFGKRILVVDDQPFAVRSLARVLEAQGCKVVCITQAEEVFELDPIDAVFDAGIVDYKLGVRRGPEVILWLRTRPRPCCSLMITGKTAVEFRREAIAAGADEILQKPFEMQEFLAALSRVIYMTSKLRAQLEAHRPEFPGEAPPFIDSTRTPQSVPPLPPELVSPPSGIAAPLNGQTGSLDEWVDRLSNLGELSPRERDVLREMLRGSDNKKAADDLKISARTVKFHVSNVLKKLSARSRKDLFRLILRVEIDEPMVDDESDELEAANDPGEPDDNDPTGASGAPD